MVSRRLLFVLALLALPLALFLPMRAARSWQPRELKLARASSARADEITGFCWRGSGLLLFRQQSSQRKTARALFNWNGASVALRFLRAEKGVSEGAGETAAQLQYLGGGRYDVELWDVPGAGALNGATATLREQKGHSHFGQKALALSRDGNSLAADLIYPNAVQIADARSGEIKARFVVPTRAKGGQRVSTDICALAWSPDGRQLAVIGLEHIWFVDPQGQLLRVGNKPPFPFWIHAYRVEVRYSPDGKMLAISTGHVFSPFFSGASKGHKIQLRLYDAQSGAVLFGWAESSDSSAESEGVTNLDFSPDGKHLAFGTYKGQTLLMNLRSGAIERDFSASSTLNPAPQFVAYAPDGQTLAVAAPDRITLWRVR